MCLRCNKTMGAAGQLGNSLKSLNVSVSSRLGLKVTGTLGAPRYLTDSTPIPKNAVTGSLNVQF